MSERAYAHLCRRCMHLITEHRMGKRSNTTFWCRICRCPIGHESPQVPMTRRQFAIYDGLKADRRAAFGATVIRNHDEAARPAERSTGTEGAGG